MAINLSTERSQNFVKQYLTTWKQFLLDQTSEVLRKSLHKGALFYHRFLSWIRISWQRRQALRSWIPPPLVQIVTCKGIGTFLAPHTLNLVDLCLDGRTSFYDHKTVGLCHNGISGSHEFSFFCQKCVPHQTFFSHFFMGLLVFNIIHFDC